ncbi:hypothetical protein KV564_24180 [Paenibacillus chitinolyticus]|nr:hypothetical protein [Paenibacillus chitinolyticus]
MGMLIKTSDQGVEGMAISHAGEHRVVYKEEHLERVTLPELQSLGDLIRFEHTLAKRCAEEAESSTDVELREVLEQLAVLRLGCARQLLAALRSTEL